MALILEISGTLPRDILFTHTNSCRTVGDYQFGIQIKPVTANANFGGYSLSERMKASFNDFTEKYGGKVFIGYGQKGEIANTEVIDSIREEIERLQNL